MVTPGTVVCEKCGEDRPTLIHKIVDPLGERFYCCVCGHEFKAPCSPEPSNKLRSYGSVRDPRAVCRIDPA